MSLKSFRQTEIRSSVMGILVTITEEVIAKACRVAPTGRFLWNITGKHPLMSSYTSVVLKGDSATKLVNIDNNHRMLLKFLTECFLQKGGGSDQPSADHKLVLYFLSSFNKINLPRYIMHHLCWAIKEGIGSKRKQIPCGRLLSEIFTQGKILEILRRNNLDSDNFLRTRTGKIINGKTLQNMKIIKKFSPNEKDLKDSTTPTKLMKDFPSILQERNHELLFKLVAESVKDADICLDVDTPVVAPLQVRRKRTATDAGSEAKEAQTKKSRKDTPDASASDISSVPMLKRKRRREAPPVNSQEKLEEARKQRAKEMRDFKRKYETLDFVMTPAKAREAQKQIEELMAARNKEKAALKAARDEKLQSIGIDASDDYFMEKLVEVREIAGSVEKQVVKEVTKMLEKIPEASEADESIAAPESTSVAEVSEASAQVTQTSSLPFIIPTHVSPSSDSDLDGIPIGQRMRKL